MEDIDRLRELFEEALDAPAHRRDAMMAQLDQHDPAAASRLRRMLAVDAEASSVGAGSGQTDGSADDPDSALTVADHVRGTPRRAGHPVGRQSDRPVPSRPVPSRPGTDGFRFLVPESSRVQLAMPVDSPTVEGIHLDGLIGSGGLGRVYRAVQGRRVVAVKVPRPDRLDESFLARWREECALAHELPAHPNIVTVHQIGLARYADGTEAPAIVMEYLPGATDLLTHAARHQLDRDARIDLFRQACRGVSHLHQRAVVHGDLKPSNLLVIDTPDGPLLKVGDLGGTRTMLRHDTRPAQFTWVYASPEQIADDPVKIGPQSDVYSLGKVLTALLCGDDSVRLPAGVDRRAYAGWRPPPIAERLGLADGRLEEVLRRATARHPADRHDDALALGAAIRSCTMPLPQRALLAVGGWLNPDRSPRRAVRAMAARAVTVVAIATLCTLAAALLCAESVRHSTRFQIVLGAPMPATLDHVAMVRLRDREEVAEVVSAFAIDGVDPEVTVTYRRLWAAVTRRLAAAGAKVIVFDIAFPLNPDPTLNDVILHAVRDARRAGSAVVVGVQAPEIRPGPHRIAPDLRDEVDLIGDMRILPAVPGLGSTIMTVDRVGTAPRLPLAIAAAAATQASYGERDRLQVQIEAAERRIVVRGARPPGLSIDIVRFEPYAPESRDQSYALYPFGVDPGERLGFYAFEVPDDDLMHSAEVRVADVLDPHGLDGLRRRVEGRVVILANNADPRQPDIHEFVPARREAFGPPRSVPGPWFHAAAVESILSQLPAPAVRRVPLGAAGFVVGLAVLGGWWAGVLHFRRRGRHHAPPRSLTRQTAVGSAIWLASWPLVVVGFFGLGLALALTVQYIVAVTLLGIALGVLAGLGLGLRAAWSRRAQRAALRELTHAW